MYKILVVDDEPDLERMMSQIFRAAIKQGDYSFVFADNGMVALEKLKVDPLIDIIFTDINMPVMDGLTLLTKLKEQGFFQRAVVISAYGDLKNIRTAMNRGAFDFITKPIDFDDVRTTLQKAVREMEMLKQGVEAKKNLEKALVEKAEAQQQALQHLQEKEKLILHQNELLESQVTERTMQVMQQKEFIEVKNKEILDSINYAKRLQEAILPPSNLLNSYLPESFILYQPKDIVAGDFYWIEKSESQILIAAADCTGHGVPGALMSMLGVSLLNQIVLEKNISTPSEILNLLHNAVITALKQTENDTNDGMDIALCSFNLSGKFSADGKNILQFAGANRPLWLVRNNKIEVINADKFPIGGMQLTERKLFNNITLELAENDTIYLFTDGFADQFGGEKGKKLMSNKFREIILSIQDKNLNEQKNYLKDFFNEWKGTIEQVDDVLVIGIRI